MYRVSSTTDMSTVKYLPPQRAGDTWIVLVTAAGQETGAQYVIDTTEVARGWIPVVWSALVQSPLCLISYTVSAGFCVCVHAGYLTAHAVTRNRATRLRASVDTALCMFSDHLRLICDDALVNLFQGGDSIAKGSVIVKMFDEIIQCVLVKQLRCIFVSTLCLNLKWLCGHGN